MGKHIAERTVKMLIAAGKQVRGARVAVLGLTFKEDVPDLRNTRVVDIIHELKDYNVNVMVSDPLADPEEAQKYYGVNLQPLPEIINLDAVILAVMHQEYRNGGLAGIAGMCSDSNALIVDVKGCFTRQEAEALGMTYWRL
jgi:UDP-N-acetyl-D-galactosamine dehydrogenase